MKRAFMILRAFKKPLSLAFIASIIVAAFFHRQGSPLGGEGLEADPESRHLGKILQHESSSFSFQLKNTGPASLEILGLENSCGCITSQISTSFLKPGETARVTGTLSAGEQLGTFGSQILVSFRRLPDGGKETARLAVAGEAVSLIDLPPHLDLGSLRLGSPPAALEFALPKGGALRDWDEIRHESKMAGVFAEKMPGNGEWKLRVIPPSGPAAGDYRDILTLTLLKEGREIGRQKAALSWKVSSDNFSLSRSSLYLKAGGSGRIIASSRKDRELELKSVRIPQGAPFRISNHREGGKILIEIEAFQIAGKPQTQDLWSGKIQVTLSDGFSEESFWINVLST
jgi:hypothetical protein